MNKAKETFLKITLVAIVIWLVLLIVGLVSDHLATVANVLFGLGALALVPVLALFFQNKALGKVKVTRQDATNYLTSEEYRSWAENKTRFEQCVLSRRNHYRIGFSGSWAILYIGTAALMSFL